MADQAEKIVLEAEDTVTPITNRANASLDSFEKKAESSHGKVIRISDQTRTSVQRLITSLEKQAEVYGKAGVDKLVSQRDQLLQRYAKEPAAIDAITKSYEKMISVQKQLDSAAKFDGTGDRIRQGLENPLQAARGAISNVLTAMGPMGIAVTVGATALSGIALAGWEAAKSLGEYGTRIKDVELRTGLTAKEVGQFSYAARAVGQDISFVERTMRGLTSALEDETPKADRARETLRKFGVDIEGVKSGTASTSDVLLKISEGLNGMPNVFERNAAGIEIFKKAWIELAPAVLELNQGVARARELGFGPDQAEIDLLSQYEKTTAAAAMQWEKISRSMKEAIALPSIWMLTAGGILDDHEPRKPHRATSASLGSAPGMAWSRCRESKRIAPAE